MAEVSNEISVAFGALKTKTTGGIYRLDEEQYLVFTDIDLPESFRADFGLSETGDTISMVGTENRVLIPDELLVNAGKLHCWVWLDTGEYGGKTALNQLDQNMAYVESGNTASRTYAVGDFISWKGTLYKASTAIPATTAFAIGTNLATVVDSGGNLCGGLNSLKSAGDYSTTVESEIGYWNGQKLYRKVFDFQKTTPDYSSVGIIPVYAGIKYFEDILINSYLATAPYLVNSSDVFRVNIDILGGSVMVETGTAYPALPATVRVIAYYTK